MHNNQSYCLVDDIALLEQLHSFEKISLAEMDQVELQHRRDTKYLFHISKLGSLLSGITAAYKILKIGEKIIFSYQSNYYDTPDLAMFRDQHNERSNRYKVRTRTYLDSRQSYIEVKYKNNKEHTLKHRSRLGGTRIADFVDEHTPYRFEDMNMKLMINFSRFTLVDKAYTERVTIDTGLIYRMEGEIYHFPELVILELKQERNQSKSLIAGVLRERRMLPKKISKYCFGISLHYTNIRKNRYKEKIRYIQRIINNYE